MPGSGLGSARGVGLIAAPFTAPAVLTEAGMASTGPVPIGVSSRLTSCGLEPTSISRDAALLAASVARTTCLPGGRSTSAGEIFADGG